MERLPIVYSVSGFVFGIFEMRQVEAVSAKQACYRFCREMKLDEADDVPGLRAVNIDDPDDWYQAENGGFLE